ncbi:MAG: cation transporter [Verrucomicrobiota bacterium]
MKTIILSCVAAMALCLSSSAADTTVQLSDVHLCCKSCVTGVEKAVGKVPGATATVDQEAGTVAISGPDTKTVQKAANALVKAGYFGKSNNPEIKLAAKTGAQGKKVSTLKIDGVHLCCAKCVKAVNQTLASVDGVKANTATKGATSFEVTGDFNDQEVFTALQKAGLSGKVE